MEVKTINLRELKETDAVPMLEWMHDPDIQKGFIRDMLGTSLENAQLFCRESAIPEKIEQGDDLHFAIVNQDDEYLGTISLKHIDFQNGSAEYAIATRKKAHHTGTALIATKLLLEKAFHEYGLHRVYLSVLENNIAAIKLYEKCGFLFEGEFKEHIRKDGHYYNWKWYGILDYQYDRRAKAGS